MMTSMKEVAKRAGVSIATVSAVVNENKYVSEDLKKKIEEAIKELNYRPNRLARSLKGKETKLIGVTVTEITNPFYPLMLKGVEDVALSFGYNVILSTTADDQEQEYTLLESMLDQGVDGVILATIDTVHSKALQLLLKENVPTVLINRSPKDFNGMKVCIDSYKVGELATEHLIELGHEKIAFFGGQRQNSIERERAFLDRMKLNHLSVPQDWLIDCGYEPEKTYQLTMELLNQEEIPTAIFAASDLIAFSVARAVMDKGYEIPRDISVIGADNIPFTADFRVPLTTIDVQTYEIGKIGCELLLKTLTGKDLNETDRVVLEPTLIHRNSTGVVKNN